MNIDQIRERLTYVVRQYKGDFEVQWQKYLSLCGQHGKEPLDLLSNPEHYVGFEHIGVGWNPTPQCFLFFVIQLRSHWHSDKQTNKQTKGSIQDRIAKAIAGLEEEIPAIKDERLERRARKRARLEEERAEKEGKVCRCGNKKFLGLVSRANDGNYWTLPSGKTGEGIRVIKMWTKKNIS